MQVKEGVFSVRSLTGAPRGMTASPEGDMSALMEKRAS